VFFNFGVITGKTAVAREISRDKLFDVFCIFSSIQIFINKIRVFVQSNSFWAITTTVNTKADVCTVNIHILT
jgi:hypothetical protein